MSEDEFDLLDELYFVQSYDYLKGELGWEDGLLLSTLQQLLKMEYIKCLINPDQELHGDIDLTEAGKEYYFLATKKGLLAHNTL
ncbi:hypothetical protein GCM10007049_37300 [Echinicola pacifica]|uniref:Uncharacterized protein n=1 Tax=Echinicola pacifica TaxID=346377 RepID=A0A918UXQ5_9BACT|nr:hypothetical protein [Echinicola pacifica]GGZ40556.1 hypothetical protein GCM10007049_37300 [Echinicola pacifica]